jgi:hypothetical protein
LYKNSGGKDRHRPPVEKDIQDWIFWVVTKIGRHGFQISNQKRFGLAGSNLVRSPREVTRGQGVHPVLANKIFPKSNAIDEFWIVI